MTLVNTPLRRLALAPGRGLPRRLDRAVARRARARRPGPPRPRPVRPASGGTLGGISRLQAAVRRAPRRPQPRVALAGEYLQRVRETGDVAFYPRAELLLRGVLARAPRNARRARRRSAALALSRHDFAARAAARPPRAGRGWPRCRCASTRSSSSAATATPGARCSAMVDAKPNLSAYARVSYLRELHGDLAGRGERDATRRRGRRAGAGERRRRPGAARRPRAGPRPTGAARAAYESALARRPSYVPAAVAGLRPAGRRHEADLARAIRRWRPLVARLPLPEYVIGLGEAELAAGRARRRRGRTSRWSAPSSGCSRAAGVNTDVELAVFEADHGDPARGLSARAARRGRRRRACAPPTRSAGR